MAAGPASRRKRPTRSTIAVRRPKLSPILPTASESAISGSGTYSVLSGIMPPPSPNAAEVVERSAAVRRVAFSEVAAVHFAQPVPIAPEDGRTPPSPMDLVASVVVVGLDLEGGVVDAVVVAQDHPGLV